MLDSIIMLVTLVAVTVAENFQYRLNVRTCIRGHNINRTIYNKSVSECRTICNRNSACEGFEYGNALYGGYNHLAGDCIPQSSANITDCDGARYNLDLYTKHKFAPNGCGLPDVVARCWADPLCERLARSCVLYAIHDLDYRGWRNGHATG